MRFEEGRAGTPLFRSRIPPLQRVRFPVREGHHIVPSGAIACSPIRLYSSMRAYTKTWAKPGNYQLNTHRVIYFTLQIAGGGCFGACHPWR